VIGACSLWRVLLGGLEGGCFDGKGGLVCILGGYFG